MIFFPFSSPTKWCTIRWANTVISSEHVLIADTVSRGRTWRHTDTDRFCHSRLESPYSSPIDLPRDTFHVRKAEASRNLLVPNSNDRWDRKASSSLFPYAPIISTCHLPSPPLFLWLSLEFHAIFIFGSIGACRMPCGKEIFTYDSNVKI